MMDIEKWPSFEDFDKITMGWDNGYYSMWGVIDGSIYVLDQWKGE